MRTRIGPNRSRIRNVPVERVADAADRATIPSDSLQDAADVPAEKARTAFDQFDRRQDFPMSRRLQEPHVFRSGVDRILP
jgi:hypothetical protein